jgi:hypothetical protein
MAWTKVLPPHFLAARETALIRAHQYEEENGIISSPPILQQQQQQQQPYPRVPQTYMDDDPAFYPDNHHPPYDNAITTGNNMMRYSAATALQQQQQNMYVQSNNSYGPQSHPVYGAIQQHQYGPPAIDMSSPNVFSGGNYGPTQHAYHQNNNTVTTMYSPNMMHASDHTFLRNVAEEGAFMDGTVPIDEAIATHGGYHLPRPLIGVNNNNNNNTPSGIDPPEDEPPSLRKRGGGGGMAYHGGGSQLSVSSAEPSMNSPQYESSPLNNDDDEPISPAFVPSPSDFGDNDDAIRYSNDDFHDDRHQYFPAQSGNARYPNMEEQQQRYGPRYENDETDDYERSPEYESDGKFDEHDTYQYDHSASYGNKKYYESEFDEAAPQYQPSDQVNNGPNIYQTHVDDDYDDDIVDQFEDITPQPSGVPFSDPGDDLGYDDNGFPTEKVRATSLPSDSEYSAPTMNDDGFSNGLLYMSTSTDDNIEAPLETTRRGNVSLHQQAQPRKNSSEVHHFPPVSPRSGHGSEFSQSSAMRGAQELLRRNRQKRLELAMRMKQQVRQYQEHDDTNDATTDENQDKGGVNHMLNTNDVISPQSQDSSSTWQTGVSEYTGSEVTGGSSIWTETENNPDRSSRRALILQMARARMKNQGGGSAKPQQHPNTLEEKKLEHIQESSNDVDFAVDLD